MKAINIIKLLTLLRLNGLKTYIIAVGLMMFAVGGWASGMVTVDESIQSIFMALGMMGLRHGINTTYKKPKKKPKKGTGNGKRNRENKNTKR